MPIYIIKPIVWNAHQYQTPSGAKFITGYPSENGYGHEEWNNSDRLELVDNRVKYRLFYTNKIDRKKDDQSSENLFIFMIASHLNKQYLVGVAGEVESLGGNLSEQKRLLRACGLTERTFGADAWACDSVREKFRNEREFKADFSWKPQWKCPSNLYLWLKSPLLLIPQEISGKKKLISMYGSYQEISEDVASTILGKIPASENLAILNNLKVRIGGVDIDLVTDIREINADASIPSTTKAALIQARIGQGKFRKDLLSLWDNACAVTGCTIEAILRASHIMPWKRANNTQRLDKYNGLPLEATFDALFDCGLISFSDKGEMLISSQIESSDRQRLGIPRKLLKSPTSFQQGYLKDHRENTFVK